MTFSKVHRLKEWFCWVLDTFVLLLDEIQMSLATGLLSTVSNKLARGDLFILLSIFACSDREMPSLVGIDFLQLVRICELRVTILFTLAEK